MAVGALVSGYSAYRGYQAKQQQAEYQQEMAEYNARVRQQQIEQEAEAAAQEQLDIRERGREAIGKQESLLASSGVSMTSGSPLELLAQTTADIQRDVDLAEYEAERRQASIESKKIGSEMRAEQAGKRADKLSTAKYIGTATSLLAGGRSGYKSGKKAGKLYNEWT